jgi:hypothetical protein
MVQKVPFPEGYTLPISLNRHFLRRKLKHGGYYVWRGSHLKWL